MAGPSFVVPEVFSARRMYEAAAGLGRARWAADRLLSTRYTPPVRRALAGPQLPATNAHPDR